MCGAGCVSNLPRLHFIDQSAQLVGRGYHLLTPLLHTYCSPQLIREISDLHEAAHTVEHVLHPFYLIGDVIQLNNILFDSTKRASFFQKKNGLKIAATILHTTSHLIVTLEFCKKMRFFSTPGILKISPFTSTIHALALSLLIVDQLLKGEKIKKIGRTAIALISQFSYIPSLEKLPYVSVISEIAGLTQAFMVLKKGIHLHSH